MNLIRTLGELIPSSPAGALPWDALEALFASTCFSRMRDIPQDPVFHGEGDVLTHTRMVCAFLAGMPAFHALPETRKAALFLAALLHDIGKVQTTRPEGGTWASPNHSPVGSRIVRRFLWEEEGLCGTPESLRFRETVCALVRYHMLPVRIAESDDPARRLRKVAAVGELAPDFSWELLCLLAEADIGGRIAADSAEHRDRVQLCRLLAEEAGCLTGPYPFPDAYTRRAYLSGRNVLPDQPLFDSTWGKVVLMAGLPGTGKDTWIRERLPGLPMVSLDGIRRSLGVRPEDSQGGVVRAAQEQARAFLRRKQAFVWNATSLTAETREKVIRLAESYGAGVRVVYLEASLKDRTARNAARAGAVPEKAVSEMLSKTVPPLPSEAETVDWLCV